MEVYEDRLSFEASLKWTFEELQFLALGGDQKQSQNHSEYQIWINIHFQLSLFNLGGCQYYYICFLITFPKCQTIP